MLRDAFGNEIMIGDTVRHTHEPIPLDEVAAKGSAHLQGTPRAAGYHMFFGSAPVTVTTDITATVMSHTPSQIPVYLGKLLVVTKAVDGREVQGASE